MWENIVGNCKFCKIPIYIDEGYHKVNNHIFEGLVCEDCYPSNKQCPICEVKYTTQNAAQECFKSCSGINY